MHFAKATPPPALRLVSWWWVSIVLGLGNAALIVAQLASFEDFRGIIEDYGFVSASWSAAVALGLTALEILSLPVLLRLSLSPAMRVLSTYAVMTVPIAWGVLSIAVVSAGNAAIESGFVGTFAAIASGTLLWISALHLIASVAALYVLGAIGSVPRAKKPRA